MLTPFQLMAERNAGWSSNAGAIFPQWIPGLASQPLTVSPLGEMRVMTPPHQRLVDTFDSGAWDTINRWVISNGGGGVLPSAVVGTATLNSGTTLNGFSKATTLNTPAGGNSFKLTEPGFNFFFDRIQLQSPLASTAYQFWGSGTSSATPTIASPIIQGMGWEVTTAGVLVPVVYQTGTRVPAVVRPPGDTSGLPTLTSAFYQPNDTTFHKYFRWFRGDLGVWCMDDPDNVVAYYNRGAGGPDVNSLPLLYEVISNGGVAVSLSIAGLSVADTSDTSAAVLLNNGFGYDEWRSNIDTNTALINAAGVTTTQNSADQLNPNGRGVIVVLNMTAVGTGSVTLTIQGKDIVSGQYYTLLAGAAVTTNSTNVYTVYPGATATANVSASSPLPRTWRVLVTANNANATTYTVGASVIN